MKDRLPSALDAYSSAYTTGTAVMRIIVFMSNEFHLPSDDYPD